MNEVFSNSKNEMVAAIVAHKRRVQYTLLACSALLSASVTVAAFRQSPPTIRANSLTLVNTSSEEVAHIGIKQNDPPALTGLILFTPKSQLTMEGQSFSLDQLGTSIDILPQWCTLRSDVQSIHLQSVLSRAWLGFKARDSRAKLNLRIDDKTSMELTSMTGLDVVGIGVRDRGARLWLDSKSDWQSPLSR